MCKLRTIIIALLLSSMLLPVWSQLAYEDIQAGQSFRDGVMRFHDGLYAESVLLFQKSLALRAKGNEAIQARIFLGRAYFHAGFEDAAVHEWKTVAELGGIGPALNSFLEYLTGRSGLAQSIGEDYEFFSVQTVSNSSSLAKMRRPSATISLPNGETLLASFGTNAIAVMDANGRLTRTLRGGLTRLSGPFSMALVDGVRLYVTQTLGDQVYEMRSDGSVVKAWGKKGIAEGEFMGPQYICADDKGYLYVSDYGNRRVQKFDADGNFILAMGMKTAGFDGLSRPTGLYWVKGVLYVIDARRSSSRMLMFDSSGNLLDMFDDDRFATAEGMGFFGGNKLLLSFSKSIATFDTETQTITPLHVSDRSPVRYTNAGLDANGNVVAVDFDGEKIELLSRLAGMYSGLHVQVNRVIADAFPEVFIDATITDNFGNPVLGLDQTNFLVTEASKPAAGWQLIGAGHNEQKVDAMVLVESSPLSSEPANQEAIRNAIRNTIDQGGADSRYGLVSTGRNPGLEAQLGSGKAAIEAALSNLPADLDWSFDKALRLSVPALIKSQNIRHILFISLGNLPETAFTTYGLQETLHYLRNNRIRFSVLNTRSGIIDPSLQYLVQETGGLYQEVYQTRGFAGLDRLLRAVKDGAYYFKYKSVIDPDFGRKYLPIELEARLFQKSGRDETGYFAPRKL